MKLNILKEKKKKRRSKAEKKTEQQIEIIGLKRTQDKNFQQFFFTSFSRLRFLFFSIFVSKENNKFLSSFGLTGYRIPIILCCTYICTVVHVTQKRKIYAKRKYTNWHSFAFIVIYLIFLLFCSNSLVLLFKNHNTSIFGLNLFYGLCKKSYPKCWHEPFYLWRDQNKARRETQTKLSNHKLYF